MVEFSSVQRFRFHGRLCSKSAKKCKDNYGTVNNYHFLLYGSNILFQIEEPENLGADGTEAILAVAKQDIEFFIDAGGYERAAHQSETFIKAAVQFT
jgi:hypothetical protein